MPKDSNNSQLFVIVPERRADEYLEEPRLDYNDGGPVGAEEKADMPPRMQPEVHSFDSNQQVCSQFRIQSPTN